jgi:hypothetical protein
MALRRGFLRQGADRGLVAVYDALLFLMVVILISVGMFLYSARTVSDGGQFSDDVYQHQAETQLIMVEGLSYHEREINNTTVEVYRMPQVEYIVNNTSTTLALSELVGGVEAFTTRLMLKTYCDLKSDNENSNPSTGQYDLHDIISVVQMIFNGTQLFDTYYFWVFTYNGSVEMNGTNSDLSILNLPDERWAATSDYSEYRIIDLQSGEREYKYRAELRYYLWYP